MAHRSQLFHVPDDVSDENAIMVDAFCSTLHPVIRNLPCDQDMVLIIGAGTISICTLAALRALDSRARVIVLARYPFQGQLAWRYGADEVIYLDKGGKTKGGAGRREVVPADTRQTGDDRGRRRDL